MVRRLDARAGGILDGTDVTLVAASVHDPVLQRRAQTGPDAARFRCRARPACLSPRPCSSRVLASDPPPPRACSRSPSPEPSARTCVRAPSVEGLEPGAQPGDSAGRVPRCPGTSRRPSEGPLSGGTAPNPSSLGEVRSLAHSPAAAALGQPQSSAHSSAARADPDLGRRAGPAPGVLTV